MKLIKLFCGFGFLLLLASNVWAISRWSESRGVYDDICYLRQAHLFQKFGVRGLDTNITLDDDRYLAGKLKEIGFPTWNDGRRPRVTPSFRQRKMGHAISAGHRICARDVPLGLSGETALRPGQRHHLLLCAARAVLCAPAGLGRARRRVWFCRDLSDDQSREGELFDAADHGGLRTRGLSDRKAVCG